MLNGSNHKEGFNPKRIQLLTTVWAIVPGVIAVGATLFFFFLCLLIFPLTTFLPNLLPVRPNPDPVSWDFLGSITSLATFALILGGLVFAFIDYVQNAVQRKREESESSFSIYKEMYERLMSQDALAARRWVIVNLPVLEDMNNDKDAWFLQVKNRINELPSGSTGGRAPGKDYVKQILNDFDFIGFVNKNYWKMENEVVEWMSPPVAKVWERIHLYVEDEAKERNEPDYYKSAREFADYCLKWRRDNFPKSKVIKNGT